MNVTVSTITSAWRLLVALVVDTQSVRALMHQRAHLRIRGSLRVNRDPPTPGVAVSAGPTRNPLETDREAKRFCESPAAA